MGNKMPVKQNEAAPILARLPHDVKSWIEREAARNGASQNSEIIRAIRARMLEENHAAEVHKTLRATKLKELTASSRQGRGRKLQTTKPGL
jgi:hypothetical protein